MTPSRASCRSRTTSGRPGTVTGQSGTRTPGRRHRDVAAAGRPGNGRRGSGVVSGESTYQNGSASRPESTCARAAGSFAARSRTSRRRRASSSLPGTRNRMVAGDLEVLQRRGVPLVVVAVQQRLRGPAAGDEGDLPGGVLGVEDAGVQSAGAERGVQVRGVAGDQHPADPHPVDDPGGEAVDRPPDDLVGPVADHLPDAPVQAPGGLLGGQVEVRRHLPVDAEGGVGAGVDEHLAAGVPLRVEVEPALGLPAGQVGADVADQELVVEGLPLEGEPRPTARRYRGRRRRRPRRSPRPRTSPSAVAQVTVTPVASCSMPVTRCPQRTSISGSAAIRSSSSRSVSHCEMFTNGGNGERPRSAKWKGRARCRGGRCGRSSR